MSAKLATELVAEEMQRRHYSVSQAFLQGDILPLVKHLAFAGRFQRPDLQHTSCMILGKGNHGTLTLESGCTVPKRANVVSDYLAGVASRSAQQAVLADEDAMPFDVEVPAPYWLAPESGAIQSYTSLNKHNLRLQKLASSLHILIMPKTNSQQLHT